MVNYEHSIKNFKKSCINATSLNSAKHAIRENLQDLPHASIKSKCIDKIKEKKSIVVHQGLILKSSGMFSI